jgi:hypothetical protein
MDNIKKTIDRVISWYRKLPEKKQHVEFITALLSVPVMLTVIIINLNNLNQQKNASQKQISEKILPVQVVITGEKQNQINESPTVPASQSANIPSPTATSCIKEVGMVSIVSPRENEVVAKDPVCITIATQSGYCSLNWSYRLDNGDWSEYTDKNICLHNLTNGEKTLQLKIKSSASSDVVTLQRSFIYQGNSEPTTDPKASASAGL